METIKSPPFFYSMILTGCLGSLTMGYQVGIYNTCQNLISSHYGLNSDENKHFYEGLITSSISFGAIIGAFYSSTLMKNGRRSAFIIIDIASIISVFFIYFSGIFALILSRLLSGICLGLNSVIVPIFIKEFSPIEISGSMGSLHSVFISAGVLLSFFFGFLVPFNNNFMEYGISLWRFLLGVPILISACRISLLIKFFRFETPSFLWKKRKESQAKIVLEILYKETYLTEFTKSMNSNDRNLRFYKDLFSPNYINQTIFGIVLSIIQQLSGINALIFYSNQIFAEDGNENIAIIFTFILGILLTFTALISGKFMDTFGRRKAILYGDFCLVCSLGLMIFLKTTALSYLNKYMILIFIFSFGISLGPILWVYLAETLPEKGIGLAILINWTISLIITLIFPKMINSLGFVGTFSIFFISSSFGFIYILNYMVETKGKSPIEITKICQYEAVFI